MAEFITPTKLNKLKNLFESTLNIITPNSEQLVSELADKYIDKLSVLSDEFTSELLNLAHTEENYDQIDMETRCKNAMEHFQKEFSNFIVLECDLNVKNSEDNEEHEEHEDNSIKELKTLKDSYTLKPCDNINVKIWDKRKCNIISWTSTPSSQNLDTMTPLDKNCRLITKTFVITNINVNGYYICYETSTLEQWHISCYYPHIKKIEYLPTITVLPKLTSMYETVVYVYGWAKYEWLETEDKFNEHLKKNEEFQKNVQNWMKFFES